MANSLFILTRNVLLLKLAKEAQAATRLILIGDSEPTFCWQNSVTRRPAASLQGVDSAGTGSSSMRRHEKQRVGGRLLVLYSTVQACSNKDTPLLR